MARLPCKRGRRCSDKYLERFNWRFVGCCGSGTRCGHMSQNAQRQRPQEVSQQLEQHQRLPTGNEETETQPLRAEVFHRPLQRPNPRRSVEMADRTWIRQMLASIPGWASRPWQDRFDAEYWTAHLRARLLGARAVPSIIWRAVRDFRRRLAQRRSPPPLESYPAGHGGGFLVN